MAERRMFAKTIIDSDAFLDMPMSTQCLYFHLSMRADDEGFINNPKRIQRMIGASDDDLKLLLAKNFLIAFDTGVVVIKHWRIHNYIQKDRFKETVYQEEKSLLSLKENGAYTIGESDAIFLTDTSCIQDVYSLETQDRLGKERIDKDSIGKVSEGKGKESTLDLVKRLLVDYSFSEEAEKMILDWSKYKMERKEQYKETGAKSLLSQIQNKIFEYGEKPVLDLIDECMANNWKGIIWDKLEKAKPKKTTSIVDEWMNA